MTETFEECCARHKKEKKDLQAEIQRLKHSVPKGDKRKKKEITDRISELELDLETRQKSEVDRFSANNCDVPNPNDENNVENSLLKEVEKVNISDNVNNEASAPQNGDDVPGFRFAEVDKKSGKARRRKEKKDLKNKEQEENIREQEIKNLTGPRMLEQQQILSLLRPRNLIIKEIPSDGDCLYSAIRDQLAQRGVQTTVETLRQETASHMHAHIDDFLPFLIHELTGDLYTTDEFAEYCRKVKETSEWGGHTEIRALSDVHRVAVEVLQAEGSSILIGEQFNQALPLIITYHKYAYGLGAHYNSVQPASINNTSADKS